jgi:hypothetical protein
MVRQIENLLRELGWADGFHIPVANDENKVLEEQVTDFMFVMSDSVRIDQ